MSWVACESKQRVLRPDTEKFIKGGRMATVKAQITNGPSLFDLMLAFFDRNGNAGTTRHVTFQTDKGTIVFLINGLEHEDGSGVSFNFKGYCKSDGIHAFGYYHAQKRSGFIRTIDE